MRSTALLLVLLAAGYPNPAASATALPVESAAVQTRLNAQLAKLAGNKPTQTPAMEVAIAQNGGIVYDRVFGTALLDTRFPIGSITKMFTAVAVMQLAQTNRVDLDARVSKYLPTAPYADQIAVRQLLQHTSGLWNYGDYAFNTGLVSKPTTPAAVLALVAQHPLTSPPGTKWEYSNTGYVILGLIVEHVSGEPLARYEREHIFQPAGMTQTTMGNPPSSVPVAVGYMSAGGSRADEYDTSWTFACGDIVSTASDLARFDIALLDGKLVSPATFAQMQADVVPSDLGMQGLGVNVISWHGLQLVGHHGGLPGFESENVTVPTQRLAWIVLSNAFDFGTNRASGVVAGALFPTFTEPTAAPIPEDRAVTERFREALASFFQGKVDRSQYTGTANAALTPELIARTATQLKPLGAVAKIRFVGVDKLAGETVYSYSVTFTNGQTLTWRFVLDANGKIAGIGAR